MKISPNETPVPTATKLRVMNSATLVGLTAISAINWLASITAGVLFVSSHLT